MQQEWELSASYMYNRVWVNCHRPSNIKLLIKKNQSNKVKDIFSMATKGLDQIGRSGAFHHIVRRACTMTDTAYMN